MLNTCEVVEISHRCYYVCISLTPRRLWDAFINLELKNLDHTILDNTILDRRYLDCTNLKCTNQELQI